MGNAPIRRRHNYWVSCPARREDAPIRRPGDTNGECPPRPGRRKWSKTMAAWTTSKLVTPLTPFLSFLDEWYWAQVDLLPPSCTFLLLTETRELSAVLEKIMRISSATLNVATLSDQPLEVGNNFRTTCQERNISLHWPSLSLHLTFDGQNLKLVVHTCQ